MADRTTGDITIDADYAKIFDVIADLPVYPEWSDGVVAAEILEITPEGRPLVVHMKIASGPMKEEMMLRYDWATTDPESVSWTLTEGGMTKSLDGTYTLEADGGGTKVTYAMVTELSTPMPGFVKKKLEKKIVKTALKGLKARVESV